MSIFFSMYQSTIFGTSVRPRAPPNAVPFHTRPVTSWNGRVAISAPEVATPMMIHWHERSDMRVRCSPDVIRIVATSGASPFGRASRARRALTRAPQGEEQILCQFRLILQGEEEILSKFRLILRSAEGASRRRGGPDAASILLLAPMGVIRANS